MTLATFHIRQTLTVQTKVTPAPGILAYRCQLEDADAPTTSWEGLCDALDPPTRSNWRPKPAQNWVLLHRESIDGLQRWGWSGERDNFHEVKEVSEVPLTDLSNPDYRIARFDYGAHMLFDVDGQPLVVAQLDDFLMWMRCRSRAEVLEHLRGHPHASGVGQYDENMFWWTPDLETYRRAWARCLKIDPQFPSTKFPQAIRDLDLFGLREAGYVK